MVVAVADVAGKLEADTRDHGYAEKQVRACNQCVEIGIGPEPVAPFELFEARIQAPRLPTVVDANAFDNDDHLIERLSIDDREPPIREMRAGESRIRGHVESGGGK